MTLLPRPALRWSFRVPPMTVLYFVLMAAVAVPFLGKAKCEWVECYVEAARNLKDGRDIYHQASGGYVYPPFQALFAWPVLELPARLQRVPWLAVNVLALWCALRSAWRLAGAPTKYETLIMSLGLFVGLTYFLNAMLHHQTDILLAWLLFAGCELLQKQKPMRAACCFGIAAAMKCTPLLFAPYLLWKRQPLAALMVFVVAILASLLPDLIASPAKHSTWLGEWYHTFLAPMFSSSHRPGVWASDITFNQSLIGAINRWSQTSYTLPYVVTLIEPRLSPKEMKLVILGLAGFFGLVFGLVSLLCQQQATRSVHEMSIVLCGMLLFSPMSSPAHFGVLILPASLLAQAAIVERSRVAAACLSMMLLAAAASNKDLLGGRLYSIGLWHGSVMIGCLAAWLGITWSMIQGRRSITAECCPPSTSVCQ